MPLPAAVSGEAFAFSICPYRHSACLCRLQLPNFSVSIHYISFFRRARIEPGRDRERPSQHSYQSSRQHQRLRSRQIPKQVDRRRARALTSERHDAPPLRQSPRDPERRRKGTTPAPPRENDGEGNHPASRAGRRFFRQGAARCQSPAMMLPIGSIWSTTSARPNLAIWRRIDAAFLYAPGSSETSGIPLK